ncbi:Rop family plasmid primer RNA-binding protein [Klebsiella pneumoniae]|uniref:Rop family plasmid primer RNA-binding protein n=1 Tax=Klebsiella pneumoniae TaxID=573 RepID=UPI003F696CBB
MNILLLSKDSHIDSLKQAMLLLEKLNELDLDAEADLCEKLHDDAEHLFRTLSSRLDALQDGN